MPRIPGPQRLPLLYCTVSWYRCRYCTVLSNPVNPLHPPPSRAAVRAPCVAGVRGKRVRTRACAPLRSTGLAGAMRRRQILYAAAGGGRSRERKWAAAVASTRGFRSVIVALGSTFERSYSSRSAPARDVVMGGTPRFTLRASTSSFSTMCPCIAGRASLRVLVLLLLQSLRVAAEDASCNWLYDDGDIGSKPLTYCERYGIQVSPHLWALERQWSRYTLRAQREATREAAFLDGAPDPDDEDDVYYAYDHEAGAYAYMYDDVAGDYAYQYGHGSADRQPPDLYTPEFDSWFEGLPFDLQEDRWRLLCGTMSTVEPTDANVRWCEQHQPD